MCNECIINYSAYCIYVKIDYKVWVRKVQMNPNKTEFELQDIGLNSNSKILEIEFGELNLWQQTHSTIGMYMTHILCPMVMKAIILSILSIIKTVICWLCKSGIRLYCRRFGAHADVLSTDKLYCLVSSLKAGHGNQSGAHWLDIQKGVFQREVYLDNLEWMDGDGRMAGTSI